MLSSLALSRGQGGGGSRGRGQRRGGGALNGLVHLEPGNLDPEAETKAVDPGPTATEPLN